MKCPRCGADNAERAARCYLCEYPFSSNQAGEEPPAPDEAARAQYPPPGQQAVPPPTVGEPGGYQQPPPGVYQAGFEPPPPPPKGPATVKIIIGALVALLIVVVGVGAYFLTRGKTYDIVCSAPPGYQEADQELLDELKETMEAGSEDIAVDGLYMDAAMTNFLIVAHQDMSSLLGTDAPSGEDPEEMEEWFYANKDEWVEAFNTGIIEGAGMPSEVDLYQVERLATGDAVLHMATSIAVPGMGTSLKIESLWIIKERTAFLVMLQGLSPSQDTIEFLKENITFE